MNSSNSPNVGQAIRSIREEKELSLRALSERCGLSANAISMIERGENSPTVSSLHQLSSALGVTIVDFFKQESYQTLIHIQNGKGRKMQADGLVFEGLGSGLPNQQLEPFLMNIEPGKSTLEEPAAHAGEEFVYCLEGEVEYFVGEEKFLLAPGDSLLFKATEPHGWHNPGKKLATLLLVFQTDKNQPLPHRV